MDVLLAKVTGHAVNYAIRSGITITTSYAIKQCGRLLQETPRGSAERDELLHLQVRLEGKIRIISPAIDMIELISARGNTSLESAVTLTKEIRYEIQRLGSRLSDAANEEQKLQSTDRYSHSRREQTDRELQAIIRSMKSLLAKIEDSVPLINLAITTSGVNLSTKLSGSISPSRLLQASTFLTAADTKYASQPGNRQQVGPTWTLSLYMLFAGHASRPIDETGVREATWKEVIHKARVKLVRVPLDQLYALPGESESVTQADDLIPAEAQAAEFAYQLLIIEDLDDDRVHTFEEGEQLPGPCEDVVRAGIRDVVPIHEVSKVFYADTGKILNIGGDSETNNPVLLLKRDVHADPPRRMLHRSQMGNPDFYDNPTRDDTVCEGRGASEQTEIDEQAEIDQQLLRESSPNTPVKEAVPRVVDWRLPADLDPEWLALEVYTEEGGSDSESDDYVDSRPSSSRQESPSLTGALARLKVTSPSPPPASPSSSDQQVIHSQLAALSTSPHKRPGPTMTIKTSLSLLEMLTKLTTLQQFRQESHLAIEDELLNFFLEDSATAGAGPDLQYRQRLRHDAVRRVGFDPYDESPVKRRGEEYIAHARGGASPRPELNADDFAGRLPDAPYGSASPSPLYPRAATPAGRLQSPVPSSPQSPSRPLPTRSSTGQSTPAATTNGAPSPSPFRHPTTTPPSSVKTFPQRGTHAEIHKARSPLGREMSAGGEGETDAKTGLMS